MNAMPKHLEKYQFGEVGGNRPGRLKGSLGKPIDAAMATALRRILPIALAGLKTKAQREKASEYIATWAAENPIEYIFEKLPGIVRMLPKEVIVYLVQSRMGDTQSEEAGKVADELRRIADIMEAATKGKDQKDELRIISQVVDTEEVCDNEPSPIRKVLDADP